jgi:hypothetical protein
LDSGAIQEEEEEEEEEGGEGLESGTLNLVWSRPRIYPQILRNILLLCQQSQIR